MIDPFNTLMKDDLIYNHRKWVCPVIGYDKNNITVIAQHYGEATYRKEDNYPIPLTEDIILELGWKEIKNGDKYYKTGLILGKQYKHPWYTETLVIRENSLINTYWIINGEIAIRYVHDLQHILHHTTEDEIKYDWENKRYYLYDPTYGHIYDREDKEFKKI